MATPTADARSTDYGTSARPRGEGVGTRASRSCHCDRYTDPHYSGYVPRTGPYRGGRSYRY